VFISRTLGPNGKIFSPNPYALQRLPSVPGPGAVDIAT
jgi:hypothetical protein